jgi:hypothetical protein
MAEKIEAGSPESLIGKVTIKRRAKYQFDEWMNGEEWKLTKGVDFHLDPDAFQKYFLNQAAKRGLRGATKVAGDCVHVKIVAKRKGLYMVPLDEELPE